MRRCVGRGEAGVRASSLAAPARIRSSLWSSPSSPAPVVHPSPDDGDHGPLAQGRRPGRAEEHAVAGGESERKGTTQDLDARALPEAVAGRAYLIALAATGGAGTPEWSAETGLPEWLSLDKDSGRLAGIPPAETKAPLEFDIRVSDGTDSDLLAVQLAVLPYQSEPVRVWKQLVSGVPWRAWLEQGVGFLVLWLVHLVGMNLLANAERGSVAEVMGFEKSESEQILVRKRFAMYRLIVRLTCMTAMVALLGWLVIAPMFAR